METTQNTGVKNDLRAIRVFCIALIAGVGIFAALVLLLVHFTTGPVLDPVKAAKLGDIFLVVAGVLSLACLYMAIKKYRNSISQAQEKITLAEKLSEYRKILISFLATCEFPAIFGIIGFLLTGNYFLLVISAFMLGVMVWIAPFGKKYFTELNLDWKEQQELA